MNNPGIDLVIRIKNGYMSKKEKITSPYSTFREEILKKLKNLGYIKSFDIVKGNIKSFEIELLYEDGEPVFTDAKIYSTPGRRWYVTVKQLRPVLGGLGVSILSTPKGILTNNEAKKIGTGGELLFDIW